VFHHHFLELQLSTEVVVLVAPEIILELHAVVAVRQIMLVVVVVVRQLQIQAVVEVIVVRLAGVLVDLELL
jgi:hypothetical protein